MKYHIRLVLLLVLAMSISGCSGNTFTPVSTNSPATENPTPTVEDQASLVAALEAEGATVEVGDPVIQVFFSPQGNIIKVNGADVQVFEYESAESMENEASQVAPDGGSIGTSMVTWMDTPHFYKTGHIIALYVGSDEIILGLLEKVMGPQFAGR
jgi:ABC-type Fe3+-hydroxamate transport system substrate-binding protein